MRDQAGGAGEQHHQDIHGRRMMTEHLDGEQGSANRPDDGMNGVPGCIHPRNFVGEELQHVESPGECDDPGLA